MTRLFCIMKERWVEIRKSGDFKKIGEELKVSPVVARIIRNRGVEGIDKMRAFIDPDAVSLHDGSLLYGMDSLVRIMSDKINEEKKIRIIGDYDVDGVCATFILFKGLKYFGADVDYAIPHRVEDGYGINIKLIDDARENGVDTIITCDNGISAREQTRHAKDLNMTMVITDHHEVPFEEEEEGKRFLLPEADVIVDPKLIEDEYPYKGICGAFVALKVVEQLACELNRSESEEFIDLHEELIEFASLATICDVMELNDENRNLVRLGLRLMRNSKNFGLRALIRVNEINDRALSPYHLGFIIGPSINATGRLDSSLRAMKLFTSESMEEALAIAAELKELNEERKKMTIEHSEQAINMVLSQGEPEKVICLVLENCHESLAGIIAGRVRERFSHPTFIFTKTENGLKGSGRSIDAYDMFEGLMSVSEVLTKFGGHKLAAGVSLSEENFEEFRKRINENCSLSDGDFTETVRIDMVLPLGYANLSLAKELSLLEPFGNGNETPVFACLEVTILSGRLLGANKNVAKYKVSDGDGRVYEMIYFGNIAEMENFVSEEFGEEKGSLLHSGLSVNIKLDVLYKLNVNVFNGRESAQLVLRSYR